MPLAAKRPARCWLTHLILYFCMVSGRYLRVAASPRPRWSASKIVPFLYKLLCKVITPPSATQILINAQGLIHI